MVLDFFFLFYGFSVSFEWCEGQWNGEFFFSFETQPSIEDYILDYIVESFPTSLSMR